MIWCIYSSTDRCIMAENAALQNPKFLKFIAEIDRLKKQSQLKVNSCICSIISSIKELQMFKLGMILSSSTASHPRALKSGVWQFSLDLRSSSVSLLQYSKIERSLIVKATKRHEIAILLKECFVTSGQEVVVCPLNNYLVSMLFLCCP